MVWEFNTHKTPWKLEGGNSKFVEMNNRTESRKDNKKNIKTYKG